MAASPWRLESLSLCRWIIKGWALEERFYRVLLFLFSNRDEDVKKLLELDSKDYLTSRIGIIWDRKKKYIYKFIRVMYFLFPLFLEQLYFFCSQFFYRKFNGEREREREQTIVWSSHFFSPRVPPLIFVNIARANIQSKVFAVKGKTVARYKRQI